MRRRRADGGGTWVFEAEVHARQMGSLVTACGVSAAEWPMLLDRQFDHGVVRSGLACASCVDEVRGRRVTPSCTS